MTTTAKARSMLEAALGPAAVGGVVAGVAAFVASLALASSWSGANGVSHAGPPALDVAGVLLLATSTLPLAARSRAPVAVFGITAAAAVALAATGYPIKLAVGPTVALYFLAASRDEPRPWTRALSAAVIGVLAAYLGATAAAAGARFPGIELSHTSLGWAAAWFAGERARLRRAQLTELRQRAAHAERDADRERLLAVAEERARIARDLHDSAGGAVNVIAVRAGAARMRHAAEPDRSLKALQDIEELARRTAGDIDAIVGALRDDRGFPGGVEEPHGLASLNDLIARQSANGIDVTVEVAGAPRPLGAAADQAVYRILQEALTNAARHGAGPAQVELRYNDAAVDLSVANPIGAGNRTRPGGGHGIPGMRERATLLGGALTGCRVDGSFLLQASIPYSRPTP